MMQGVVRVACIYNPISGSGKSEKRLAEFQQYVKAHAPEIILSLYRTTPEGRGGDAVARAFGAAEKDGYVIDAILIIGGDGTLSEVVNGVMQTARRDVEIVLPPIAYLAVGTGADFARAGPICRSPSEVVQAIRANTGIDVDVAFIRSLARAPTVAGAPAAATTLLAGAAAGEQTRYYINVASIGLGPDVCLRAEKLKNSCLRHFGGRAVFFGAAFVELLRMGPRRFSYRRVEAFDGIDDSRRDLDASTLVGPSWTHTEASVAAFCNGRFFGGGMNIAPSASLTDGELNLSIWRERFCSFFVGMRQVYNGRAASWPNSSNLRGSCFHIDVPPLTPDGPTAVLEADGEVGPRLPAIVGIVPNRRQRFLVSNPDVGSAV